MALTVYEFSQAFHAGQSPRIVCVGRLQDVVAVLGRETIESTFGGSIILTDEQTGEDYLGVWGARKAAKFRRLLREGGVMVAIERRMPERSRVRIKSARVMD